MASRDAAACRPPPADAHPSQVSLTSNLSSTLSDWYQQGGILAKGERDAMACEWRHVRRPLWAGDEAGGTTAARCY